MDMYSGSRKILNDKETFNKMDDDLSGFYVFDMRSEVNHKPEVSFDVKSNAYYKICFTSISNDSTLSFTYLAGRPKISENADACEIYFTKELLNKEILTLSESLGLFKPELSMSFLVNQNQEWRINEIFKGMINERNETYPGKTEMFGTLIHELILFTQRLAPLSFQ